MDVRQGKVPRPRWRHAGWGVAGVFLLLLTGSAVANSLDPTEQLHVWIDRNVVPDDASVVRELDLVSDQTCEVPLHIGVPVIALAIHGRIVLHTERAFVRISVKDAAGGNHLVSESYPLLLERGEVDLDGGCRESCLLPGVVPVTLSVWIVDAQVRLESIEFIPASHDAIASAEQLRERIRDEQAQAIVNRIQRNVYLRGQSWRVGDTGYSRLSLQQKIDRSPTGEAPAFSGFEYYVGGVFDQATASAPLIAERPGRVIGASAALVDRFDWREKHEAHRPGSPYYDGDPAGSGWMTPLAEQGCGDCWAFSPTGAMEALVNLSLNRHVDVDLSEQHLLSCSGAGDCASGSIGAALTFAASNGFVSESCFPYRAAAVSCQLGCTNPELTAWPGGLVDVPIELGEHTLKRALIDYGPVTFGIRSWRHFMVLVGFDRDDVDMETVWVVKNSFGPDWGEQGYGRLKVPIEDIYGVYAIQAVSLYENGNRVSSRCRDADGDGYAAWGLNTDRPPGCLTRDGQQDCNDASREEGPMLSSGACDINPVANDPVPTPPTEPPASTPPPSSPPPSSPSTPSSTSGGGGFGDPGLIVAALIAILAEPGRSRLRHSRSRCRQSFGSPGRAKAGIFSELPYPAFAARPTKGACSSPCATRSGDASRSPPAGIEALLGWAGNCQRRFGSAVGSGYEALSARHGSRPRS